MWYLAFTILAGRALQSQSVSCAQLRSWAASLSRWWPVLHWHASLPKEDRPRSSTRLLVLMFPWSRSVERAMLHGQEKWVALFGGGDLLVRMKLFSLPDSPPGIISFRLLSFPLQLSLSYELFIVDSSKRSISYTSHHRLKHSAQHLPSSILRYSIS